MRALVLAFAIGTLVVVPAAILHRLLHGKSGFPLPSGATLAAMSVRQRVVAIVDSQVGYGTDPADSYCNKFSFYWSAGGTACPHGEMSEKWCADFAAWVWRHAGVRFPYGYAYGDLNGAAASFYDWGLVNGTWHPAGSGYVPSPGDVAVYGLSLAAAPWAAHVAVVTSDPGGQVGPNVVNGDGNRTSFSVVETGTDQVRIVVDHTAYALSGYVSP